MGDPLLLSGSVLPYERPARKPRGQTDEVDGFNHRLNGRCRMAAHGAQITELVDQK
jgi:hypothetical protein